MEITCAGDLLALKNRRTQKRDPKMLPRGAPEGVGLVNTYKEWALRSLQGCDKDTGKADLGNNKTEQKPGIQHTVTAHKEGKLDTACDLCTNEEKASQQTVQRATDWRRRNSIKKARILLVRKVGH